jgi:flagellar hook-associated protein 1 FlgK
MGNILTTLLNSTGALSAYGRVFQTIQNNITNANTPGYAKQDQSIVALPFQPDGGPAGGVVAGPIISARSPYLEQAVRTGQQLLGSAQQRSKDLGQIEPLFSLGQNTGLPDALNQLFASFSQLGVNANDGVLRQQVLARASSVSQSFHQVAIGINTTSNNIDSSTRDTVNTVNTILDKIADINQQNITNAIAGHDAGIDAQLYSSLEDLSGSINAQVIQASDGTFNLYLGTQTPLVVGTKSFHLTADFAGGKTTIRDSTGADITSQVSSGELAAQLQDKNVTLPGYLSSLNTLAKAFADKINQGLAQGVDKNGQTPTTNLFTYNSATDAATTINITNLTPDQIAAASATAPGGGGNAIAISQLATAPLIGAATVTQAFGNIGAQVGNDVNSAKDDVSRFQDQVTQAQSQRQLASGVSYDEEAAKLLQFQQAYQAVGKLVSVLDTLTQSVLAILQPGGA